MAPYTNHLSIIRIKTTACHFVRISHKCKSQGASVLAWLLTIYRHTSSRTWGVIRKGDNLTSCQVDQEMWPELHII